jgi:mono/diheme cytochrome c family protein
MSRRLPIVLLVAALAGVGIAAAATGGSRHIGTNSVSRAATTAPTWDAVAPLFAEKCASCHRIGGIAPFSLTNARSAQKRARAIALLTRLHVMPPWMPGSDSPAFQGQSHRVLTPAEIGLIARWAKGGGKLGHGRDISPQAPAQTAPGTTVELRPAKGYRPHGTGGGTDDYHCFLLDPRLAQDSFVTSALVEPQHAGVVHHVILFDATGANVAEARALDRASGGDGWTCFGGPGLNESRASADNVASDALGAPQWISAWVPGHVTNDLPSGTGVLVHAGDLVVMQVHYNLLHDPGQRLVDRSSAVLRFAPAATTPLTPLTTFLLPAPVELPCPAGSTGPKCSRQAAFDDEVKKYGAEAAVLPLGLLYLCHEQLQQAQGQTTSCTRTLNRPLRIYGVAGHMHLRGVDIRVDLNGQTLLHIPHWSFHWQDAYYLEQPVDAAAGDALRVTCRFDNSRSRQPLLNGKPMPPRYVLWGEGTTDEMCLGLLQVASR